MMGCRFFVSNVSEFRHPFQFYETINLENSKGSIFRFSKENGKLQLFR